MSSIQRVVLSQAGIGIACVGGFFLTSPSAGTSALLACCCVLLPTMYYAWIQAQTLNAARILLHGVLKMMLTLVLVGVAIVVFGIEPLGFFATFAAMQLGYLAASGKSD